MTRGAPNPTSVLLRGRQAGRGELAKTGEKRHSARGRAWSTLAVTRSRETRGGPLPGAPGPGWPHRTLTSGFSLPPGEP